MTYSQEILTKRLMEIQQVLPNFTKASADYKNLRAKEQDLIHSINTLGFIKAPPVVKRAMSYESLIIPR